MKKKQISQGQSLVEFALTIPILLLAILVFIDLGRGVYYYSALNNAVREGARHATINLFTNSADRQTAVQQIVQEFAVSTPVDIGDITIFCDQNSSNLNNPCDSYVTVAAQLEFEPVTFFLAQIIGEGNTIAINSQSTMQMTPYGKQK
jgi:Flp pilus assembly protein TadG